MQIWLFYKNLLRENLVWLKRISIWAVLAAALGALTFVFYPGLLPKFQKFLEEVFQNILGAGELRLNFRSALLIFKNNLLVGVLSLFLGILFGLLPLLTVGVNMFIFGFMLAALVVLGNYQGFFLFALSIVPHGILELPAFLLAAAFGLKLGYSWKHLKSAFKQSLQILPLLAVLFFVAALVEIFVTGKIIDSLVGK